MEDQIEYQGIRSTKIKNVIGMLIVGGLNNFPYWVAMSSAQTIVEHFNANGLLGLVTWGVVMFGIFATSINTFLSSKNVSYNIRAVVNGSFMLFGLTGLAFAVNIWMAIACITLVGLSSDFGESVMLGYFAAVGNDSLLAAWGISTGISGVLGAVYTFLCNFFQFPYMITFLCLAPAGIIYPLAFIFLLDTKQPQIDNAKLIPNGIDSIDTPGDQIDICNDEKNMTLTSAEDTSSFCSLRLWKIAFWFFANNGITYFSQYNSISCMADCAMTQQMRKDKPWLYSLITLCYQAGQMLSRSTLKCFKSRYIVIHTVLQFSCWVLLCCNVAWRFIPFYVQAAVTVFIGLNGGISYVNIFDQTMSIPGCTNKEREMVTNYTSISISGFVIVSSLSTLLMQNTFFHYQCISR